MKFASWNVNSVRLRQNLIADWLERHDPDVLMMQEIKCETAAFPTDFFKERGYASAVVGQKSYNGVATLVKADRTEIVTDHLPGFDNPAARYVEIRTQGLVFGNLYLPNGNSGGEEGYATKLAFFEALTARAEHYLREETDFIFAGDYNVCPAAGDCAPGALAPDDALVRPQTRAAFRRLIWLGLTDALRALHPTETLYTFWDYQAGAWQRNSGIRIDHALLSPRVAERLVSVFPDKDERAMERPSDHVPLLVTLRDKTEG
ncbi:exodeoxyribonuclease III [Acetobacter thailandicus]|uniref:exodeoxyribonuclease III n=1 Tax=Acetobacter thailandicus TaxID=1502842 RepID=UPI001BA72865|nr:exodeoxyribonuclease III [Acetobacter thailandicus]MBS1002323.1 exodeoxyribonuclease III [Acetobacter thailandicus]